MNVFFRIASGQQAGFLRRLAGDVRANTLAMMAAALVPLVGMVGGGVDLSRLYIVKTRLQHACDAGALAGRKAMAGGAWNQSNDMPRRTAEQFFAANISATPYGATNVTRTYTENAGKVTGTATATVPMTLMRVLGETTRTLTVTCDAEMRLPNTDVMFVLDTTGSMACDADGKNCNSGSTSKIVALRKAVKCFYEIVARLDTDASCETGNPSGGTSAAVQLRFGFVPYATNVNVGRLLPSSYFADSWNYQSRTYRNQAAWSDWIGDSYVYPNRRGNCTKNTDVNGREWRVTKTWVNGYGDLCYHERRDYGAQWRYHQRSIDVSGLKNGTGFNNSFTVRIGNSALGSTTPTDKTITWDGCIEERPTVRATAYSPIPTDAKDLDVDLVPTGDATTKWGFALPELVYARRVMTTWDELDASQVDTANNYYNSVPYFCPKPAKKLQAWPSVTDFQTYVDNLTADGNTYHDIGILWGARLMSPTGIFASENFKTPQGGDIERHMIFMTDGDTVASNTDYAAYGLPWFDRRQTDAANPPTNEQLVAQVNARFEALCTVVKNKNITVWVISYGNGLNADTDARLTRCASPGKFFTARDNATLLTTFKSIADQISALRLIR